MKSSNFRTALLFLAGVVVALAQPQSAHPSSSQPVASAASSVPCTPRVVETVDPKTYCIETGDVLYVLVWREPEFTRLVSVSSDGKIAMPQIWDVQAAGITPLELKKILTQRLAPYVDHPDVTVTVQEVRRNKEKKN